MPRSRCSGCTAGWRQTPPRHAPPQCRHPRFPACHRHSQHTSGRLRNAPRDQQPAWKACNAEDTCRRLNSGTRRDVPAGTPHRAISRLRPCASHGRHTPATEPPAPFGGLRAACCAQHLSRTSPEDDVRGWTAVFPSSGRIPETDEHTCEQYCGKSQRRH